MKAVRFLLLTLALTQLVAAGAAWAGTLKTVKDRGALLCGVTNNVIGFATVDDKGEWKGFNVDFCRAVASAIFADPAKVRFVPLSPEERFTGLESKKVDLLSTNSTWTLSREGQHKAAFTGVNFFDGQSFLVRKERKLVSNLQLNGGRVCLESGTTSEVNFAEWAKEHNISYTPVRGPQISELAKAYEAGQCDVLTSDRSQLYAIRAALSVPGDHQILDDEISQEPIGPVVRLDDPQWFEIVKWVNFAMLDAEALKLTQVNAEAAKASPEQDVRCFVGVACDLGRQLGLSPDWALNIVRLVGNYGEVFERNLGSKSDLGIKRGLNRLVTDGGIQFAPPLR